MKNKGYKRAAALLLGCILAVSPCLTERAGLFDMVSTVSYTHLKAAAAISIIGGADGPTSIFLAGKLGQTGLMGPIAVAAYSYICLLYTSFTLTVFGIMYNELYYTKHRFFILQDVCPVN